MLRLVGISYKLEESAILTIYVVIITLHNNDDAMCIATVIWQLQPARL